MSVRSPGVPGPLEFGPFLALSADGRARLLDHSFAVTFGRGDALSVPGEEPAAALVVLSGRVRVLAADRERPLTVIAAPALVGELAVLEGRPPSAPVVAATPVRALRIPAEELRSSAAAEPPFADALRAFAEVRSANAFLRRQSPFADLPSDDLEALAAKLRIVRFAAGETLVRQGERGDDVLLIRAGDVDVTREDAQGGRHLATLGAGAMIGEIAVLTGSPRSAPVRARTDVEAFTVAGEDVRPVVKRHKALVRRLEAAMTSRHAPRRTRPCVVVPTPDDPSAVILHEEERGAYLRLDREGLAIYEDLDGDRTLRDLAMRHFARSGKLDPHGVFAAVAALQAAGFATAPRVATDAPDARLMRAADLILAPKIEIREADRLAAALHRLAAPGFTRGGAVTSVVLGGVGLLAALPILRTASPTDFGLGGILVAFAGLLVAGIGHEAAHAVATKAEGCRIGRAGIGLFWFTPVIYVDTSDTWSIPPSGRIRVNIAGPLFNLALAGASGLAARLAPAGIAQDVLVWLALANVVLVLFNISPLLEFDGYYVLADLTNTNALRRKALRFVFRDLLDRPRRPSSGQEIGFLAYTVAAILYVVGISAFVLANVPRAIDALLPQGIGDATRLGVGAVLALVLTLLLVSPFVAEAIAARVSPEASAA